MRSLDTNIVLRMLLQDQPAQAERIFDMVEAGGSNDFAVADAVFFESVWVMQGSSYNLNRQIIASLLLRLARIEQINCNRALIERVAPLFVVHKSVSFIDLALACYAELNKATPLITFDKKLAKALPDLVQTI